MLVEAPVNPEVTPSDVDGSRFEPAMPISRISPSRTNPRKVFNGIAEIAESIKAKGIVQPLVVRPLRSKLATSAAQQEVVEALGLDPETRYELVCGERRLRGAQAAGLDVVPVMIRQLTDVQVLEIQVIENNQREDVHPLEEAQGIAALKSHGMDDATIAQKLGRPLRFVVHRQQLLKLIQKFRDLWLKEPAFGIGHAFEIAKLTKNQQRTLHKDLTRQRWVPGLTQLKDLIGRTFQRDLSEASWKLDDADLVPAAGACTMCTKRTGAQSVLFDDIKQDLCLDAECFGGKRDTYVQLQIKAVAATGVEPVKIKTSYHSDAPKDAVMQYDVQRVSDKEAKKLPAGEVRPAVIVDGEDAGKTVWIRKPGKTVKSASEIKANEDRRRVEKRNAELTEQNQAVLLAVLEGADVLGDVALRICAAGMFDRLWDDYRKQICRRHGWEKPKGDRRYDWQRKAVNDYLDRCNAEASALFMLECSLLPWVKAGSGYGEDTKKLNAAAKMLGVNPDPVRKRCAAEQAAKKTVAKSKKAAGRKGGRK